MKNKTIRDMIITGFAVFAIFFGAGNLIFPGAVGLLAGDRWPVALIATFLCGILLPLLALVAVANTGDGWSALCKPVGVWYDKGAFFIATVGMVILSNLPRTAATTYEVAIKPLFPSCPAWITAVIFFVITFFLTFDQSSLIDRIGKYLTPIMLILLFIIIVKGILTPLGTPIHTVQKHVFGSSFTELYNTGDLFSGLFVSSIFLADLTKKGYANIEERKKMTVRAVFVAGIAFAIVYGGLLLLGAQSSSLCSENMDRTTLLANMVSRLLGKFGSVALSITVAMACLSTASGLIGIASEFMEAFTRRKISYRIWVIILCISSTLIACTGVENIISIASPIFLLLYPSGLTITLLGLLKKYIPNDEAFRFAVIGALIAGIFDAGSSMGIRALSWILKYIPLSSIGFDWIIFMIIGLLFGYMLGKKKIAREIKYKEKCI